MAATTSFSPAWAKVTDRAAARAVSSRVFFMVILLFAEPRLDLQPRADVGMPGLGVAGLRATLRRFFITSKYCFLILIFHFVY
ncbi:hypothetical protein FQZ97_1087990 [compost metagenome]